jgi:hypothetical protein
MPHPERQMIEIKLSQANRAWRVLPAKKITPEISSPFGAFQWKGPPSHLPAILPPLHRKKRLLNWVQGVA